MPYFGHIPQQSRSGCLRPPPVDAWMEASVVASIIHPWTPPSSIGGCLRPPSVDASVLYPWTPPSSALGCLHSPSVDSSILHPWMLPSGHQCGRTKTIPRHSDKCISGLLILGMYKKLDRVNCFLGVPVDMCSERPYQ